MHLLAFALIGCGGKNKEPEHPKPSNELVNPAPAPTPATVMSMSGSRAAPRATWAPAATKFALNMHHGTAPGNTAVSGISAYIALSMLAEGAQGSTREAYQDALGGALDKAFHIDNERALIALNDTAGVGLSSANALWVDNGVELDPSFVSALGLMYGAAPSTLPFSSDPTAAAAAINSWTEQQTHGMINELFTPAQLQGAVFSLGNAVAFDGKWLTPFEADQTKLQAFAAPSGTKQVKMMHSSEKFGYLDAEGYQVVVLPYDGKMSSLVLLLPDADSSLQALERDLTPERLLAAAKVRGRRPLELGLPRFKIELEHDLKTVFKGSVLESALTGGDYGGIAPNLSIGAAMQKVFLEVDEEGTVAAAVTGVVGTRSLPPPPLEVQFDRPFFFALWHKETGVPLFTGRVVDPG